MNENKMKQVYARQDVDKEQIRRSLFAKINAEQSPAKRGIRFKPVLAACLSLLLIVGGFSGFAIAAEAEEYREAVEFFNEYSLSTEGLTRSEIKAVYIDISMKTYSYEKTIEILNNYSIEMYSTGLGALDRESLEAMWNTRNNNIWGVGLSQKQSGIWYSVEYADPSPLNESGIPLDEAVIIKHDGENELWRYTVPYDMYVFIDDNVIVCGSGIIVYGRKDCTSSCTGNAIAFMLDNSGKLVWEYTCKTVGSEFDAAVLSEDGLALFGTTNAGVNRNSLLFTVLDMNGNVLKSRVSDVEQYSWYETAVKVGDYYLVKRYVRTSFGVIQPELLSISADGEKISSFTYSDGGVTYQIQDIAYHNGKVYLSALLPNISAADFNKRLSKLCNEYYKKWNSTDMSNSFVDIKMPDEYNERLNKLFSEAYTAVLLVCDENAAITKAYSSENARAGKLTTDDGGRLIWQVMRIDDVKNASPYLSSRRVDILATEFSFVFDDTGKLIEKNEIGAYSMMY